MEFRDGLSVELIADKDVTVLMPINDKTMEAIENAKIFVLNHQLFIDFVPKLNRKYIAPVPSNAIFGCNEQNLTVGRYGVFITSDSTAGRLMTQLAESKRNQRN